LTASDIVESCQSDPWPFVTAVTPLPSRPAEAAALPVHDSEPERRPRPAREGRGSAYEASVWVARENKRIRKSFPSLREAKAWRAETTVAVKTPQSCDDRSTTLRAAWEEWLEGAESGLIRNRSGDRYKPSALHGYKQTMNRHALARLGDERLDDLGRQQLQDMADELYRQGLDPSTIRNTLMPLCALYRRAFQRGLVTVNPTTNLALPAVRGRRDRIVTPEEAGRLLGVLPEAQRPLWATALYAGLRRGELMALRFEDVDFGHGLIRVERSYDPRSQSFVEPKSRSGRRTVPMAKVLRQYLASTKLEAGRATGLVFSEDGETVSTIASCEPWPQRAGEPMVSRWSPCTSAVIPSPV
jgi:hypothetical protein